MTSWLKEMLHNMIEKLLEINTNRCSEVQWTYEYVAYYRISMTLVIQVIIKT